MEWAPYQFFHLNWWVRILKHSLSAPLALKRVATEWLRGNKVDSKKKIPYTVSRISYQDRTQHPKSQPPFSSWKSSLSQKIKILVQLLCSPSFVLDKNRNNHTHYNIIEIWWWNCVLFWVVSLWGVSWSYCLVVKLNMGLLLYTIIGHSEKWELKDLIMRTLCDACEGAAAVVFCAADEAALCRSCDEKVCLSATSFFFFFFSLSLFGINCCIRLLVSYTYMWFFLICIGFLF